MLHFCLVGHALILFRIVSQYYNVHNSPFNNLSSHVMFYVVDLIILFCGFPLYIHIIIYVETQVKKLIEENAATS